MREPRTIFLSWSGEQSRQIGAVLKEWLEAFFNDVRVYFTPSDINPGKRWSDDLDKTLERCDVGLFVYTKGNFDSPWMAFEAGALSKRIELSRIIPLVFGSSIARLSGPLSRFQAKRFTREELLQVLNTINAGGEEPIANDVLKTKLDINWPWLEDKLAPIRQALEEDSSSDLSARSTEEILEDMYALLRASPLSDPTLANDVAQLVEQVKTTHRGSYVFIDGEKAAFSALIAATMRAKLHIRSTRFFPHAITGNQEDYGHAIYLRVVGSAIDGVDPVPQYTRIIAANNRDKLTDIDGYFRDFCGREFDLYVTRKPHSFELVIIDNEEVFVHFFGKDQVINSTLHIVGAEVTRHFIAMHERLRDPSYDPEIVKIEFKYLKESEVPRLRESIARLFPAITVGGERPTTGADHLHQSH